MVALIDLYVYRRLLSQHWIFLSLETHCVIDQVSHFELAFICDELVPGNFPEIRSVLELEKGRANAAQCVLQALLQLFLAFVDSCLPQEIYELLRRCDEPLYHFGPIDFLCLFLWALRRWWIIVSFDKLWLGESFTTNFALFLWFLCFRGADYVCNVSHMKQVTLCAIVRKGVCSHLKNLFAFNLILVWAVDDKKLAFWAGVFFAILTRCLNLEQLFQQNVIYTHACSLFLIWCQILTQLVQTNWVWWLFEHLYWVFAVSEDLLSHGVIGCCQAVTLGLLIAMARL